MSKFVTRSDIGGPSVPNEYRTELTRIIDQMQHVDLAYKLEMTLYAGGDFLEITDPTGVYSPRVSATARTAKFVVQLNNQDVMTQDDPASYLRKTIHSALCEMIDRIAASDKTYDPEIERGRIEFLKNA